MARIYRSDADAGGPTLTFEDPNAEMEFEVLREGIDPEPEPEPDPVQLDPEIAGKSNEEVNAAFARLREQAETSGGQNAELNRTLEQLNKSLGQQPQQVPTPAAVEEPEPPLPDEDEFVRDPVGASQRLIDARVAKERKELAAAMSQQAQANLTLRMQLLSREDEYFRQYQDEIKAELDALQPGVRLNPEALDFVVQRVKGRHQQEIVQSEVQKALKAANGQASGGATAPGAHVETGNTAARAPSTRRRITLTMAEQNEAQILGMAVPDRDGNIDYSNYIKHVKLEREAQQRGRRVTT